MKRLDRYIFREVLVPAAIALLVLTFALVGRQLNTLLELIVNGAASTSELWALVISILPGALVFTIPMALLIGILTGFGRMSSDSEGVALRAAGLSTWAILRPVLALGLVACALNLYLSVRATPRGLVYLEELTRVIGLRQLPLQMEPRVFNEDLGDLVFHVQDVSPDGMQWRHVFLMDLRVPGETRAYFAESARLNPVSAAVYEVTLRNGSLEITSPASSEGYTHSAFDERTFTIPLPASSVRSVASTPRQMSTSELWRSLRLPESSFAEQVELHRRLALPFACLVFVLIGLPLGISTHRGGRSMGLVVSILLMLVYYLLFVSGSRFASDAHVSPFLGAWGANLVFFGLGAVLLARCGGAGRSRLLDSLPRNLPSVRDRLPRLRRRLTRAVVHHSAWLRTLDLYLLRRFFFFLALSLTVFSALFVLVTLFELLPDIVEHDADTLTLVRYFVHYLPQIFYLVMPLSVLVSVFLSLGTLTKANEILAIKAGAVSLYRTSAPLVVVAALLSVGVYLMQDYVLPYTNQKQDEIRNTIRGRAPQTYRDPRKLMAGSDNRFYHYEYFDPQQETFAGLSVFTFDPETFAFQSWTYAAQAHWTPSHWTLDDGWTFVQTSRTLTSFEQRPGTEMTDPPEYFRKEVRVAAQMTTAELRGYIEDLERSGFEVGGLVLDLYRKMSFPVVSVIMAIIAIPFSFSTGRRGAFYGIGISILIGISYWAAFELFDKLGGVSRLSPLIAAWSPNVIYGLGGIWMLLKVRT